MMADEVAAPDRPSLLLFMPPPATGDAQGWSTFVLALQRGAFVRHHRPEARGLMWQILCEYCLRDLRMAAVCWYLGQALDGTSGDPSYVCLPLEDLAPVREGGPTPIWDGLAGLFALAPGDSAVLPAIEALRGGYPMHQVGGSVGEPTEFWWMRPLYQTRRGICRLMRSVVMYCEGSEHDTLDTSIRLRSDWVPSFSAILSRTAADRQVDLYLHSNQDYRVFHGTPMTWGPGLHKL